MKIQILKIEKNLEKKSNVDISDEIEYCESQIYLDYSINKYLSKDWRD